MIRTSEEQDKRLKVINDIIVGIKTIKCYAWEKPFEKIVSAIRFVEYSDLMRSSNVKAFAQSLATNSGNTILINYDGESLINNLLMILL